MFFFSFCISVQRMRDLAHSVQQYIHGALLFLKDYPQLFNRKSLDLVESLLRLSEVGQYEQVKQLFSFPIKHCPDMLVLALLQISTSWHTLRHELISTLMPIFLGNHPNSAIILHYAWHGQVGVDACWF